MEEILFSFGAVLQSEMNNQKINNPDIAKKLGISVNGTYDSISKFKENKGNLQKFINYVTALDKKDQFVYSVVCNLDKSTDKIKSIFLEAVNKGFSNNTDTKRFL